nr:MAG TPA: hypothetical protein [Bacteriophage sp.]
MRLLPNILLPLFNIGTLDMLQLEVNNLPCINVFNSLYSI